MPADKKKIAIIVILFLVVLAVGAFQFTSGPATPNPSGKKIAVQKSLTADDVPPLANPLVASALPVRDPFQSVKLEGEETKDPTSPAPPVLPHPTRTHMPGGLSGAFRTNRLGDVPILPNPAGNPEIRPMAVPEPPFTFSLAGILVGSRPAAVFKDAQGGQRLVVQGAALDGDTQVILIERDSVSVRFRGKTLRLTIGGNPSAK